MECLTSYRRSAFRRLAVAVVLKVGLASVIIHVHHVGNKVYNIQSVDYYLFIKIIKIKQSAMIMMKLYTHTETIDF